MSTPSDRPVIVPPLRTIGQAILVGIYTCAMTFFAGLIGQGIDLEHWPDWRIAAEAGIAAGLAFLGWTGISAANATRRRP